MFFEECEAFPPGRFFAGWDTFPPELFGEIAAHLDRPSLAVLPCVCRRWKALFEDRLSNAMPTSWAGSYTTHDLLNKGSRIHDLWLKQPARIDLARIDTRRLRRLRINEYSINKACTLTAIEDLDLSEATAEGLNVLVRDRKLARLRAQFKTPSHALPEIASLCDGGPAYLPPRPASNSRPPAHATRWITRPASFSTFDAFHPVVGGDRHLASKAWAKVTIHPLGFSHLQIKAAANTIISRYVFGTPGQPEWIELDPLGGWIVGTAFMSVVVQCTSNIEVYTLDDSSETVQGTQEHNVKMLIRTHQMLTLPGDTIKKNLFFTGYVSEIHVRCPGLRSAGLHFPWCSSEFLIWKSNPELPLPKGYPSTRGANVGIAASADADGVVRLKVHANFSRVDVANLLVRSSATSADRMVVVAHGDNVLRHVSGGMGLLYAC